VVTAHRWLDDALVAGVDEREICAVSDVRRRREGDLGADGMVGSWPAQVALDGVTDECAEIEFGHGVGGGASWTAASAIDTWSTMPTMAMSTGAPR
jgi:hypothetical protein